MEPPLRRSVHQRYFNWAFGRFAFIKTCFTCRLPAVYLPFTCRSPYMFPICKAYVPYMFLPRCLENTPFGNSFYSVREQFSPAG